MYYKFYKNIYDKRYNKIKYLKIKLLINAIMLIE